MIIKIASGRHKLVIDSIAGGVLLNGLLMIYKFLDLKAITL